MLTIKEIQTILSRLGVNRKTQTVRNWIDRNRIDAERMGSQDFYGLADVMPYIQKRVNTTETEVKELLKDIRTRLSN